MEPAPQPENFKSFEQRSHSPECREPLKQTTFKSLDFRQDILRQGWERLIENANELYEYGEITAALDSAAEALEFSVKYYGKTSRQTAVSYETLGDLISAGRKDSDLTKALGCYREALEISSALEDTPHEWLGLLNQKAGSVLYKSRRYEDAENFYREAVAEFDKAGVCDPTIRMAFYNLGIMCCNSDRLADAEKFLMRSINIGERDAVHFMARTFLGEVYRRQGKYELAERAVEPSLAFLKAGGFRESPHDAVETLRMMALIRHAQERYGEVHEFIDRAAEFIEGDDQSSILDRVRLHTISGSSYARQSDFLLAGKHLRAACSAVDGLYPNSDPAQIGPYEGMGTALWLKAEALNRILEGLEDPEAQIDSGRFEEILGRHGLAEEAVSIVKDCGGGPCLTAADITEVVIDHMDRVILRAAEYIERARDVVEQFYGTENYLTVKLVAKLGALCRLRGDDASAARHEEYARRLFDKIQGIDAAA